MSFYYRLIETIKPNVKKLTRKQTKLLLGKIEQAGKQKVASVKAY